MWHFVLCPALGQGILKHLGWPCYQNYFKGGEDIFPQEDQSASSGVAAAMTVKIGILLTCSSVKKVGQTLGCHFTSGESETVKVQLHKAKVVVNAMAKVERCFNF